MEESIKNEEERKKKIEEVLDNDLQISKEGQIVIDKSSSDKYIDKYSRRHIIDVLKLMDASSNMLKSMTYYRVFNGKTLKNMNTIKGFYEAWLDRIKYAINNPQSSLPDFFYRFTHLASESFTTGSDLQVIKDPSHSEFGKDDFTLIEKIREALIEVFGYEAFTLLDHGIMSFSRDINGNYEVIFRNHPRRESARMLNFYGIGSLIDVKTTNIFVGEQIGGYTVPTAFWSSHLIMGYTIDYNIRVIDENGNPSDQLMTMDVFPSQSLLSSLYQGYSIVTVSVTEDISSTEAQFNKRILIQFLVDYYSKVVPPVDFGTSDYIGTIDSIIEGRQILLELLYSMFIDKISNIDIRGVFPDQVLDEFYAKDVTLDYMSLYFLEYLYKPQSKTGLIERDYVKLIKDALIQNGGIIQIGSSHKGSSQTINPLFDATDPENRLDGLEITIDLSKFTPDILQKIIWTLHYDGKFEIDFNKKVKSTQHVTDSIKDPIIHLYTTLYNTLKAYSKDYYALGPRSQPRTDFSVSFYRPSLSGMSKISALSNQFSGELSRNRIDEIDFSNEENFRKQVASIVFYMVKYCSAINIKQGYYNSRINVLYADLLGILDEGYMKQNLYGDQIGGSLTNPNNDNAWLESDYLKDLPFEYSKGAFRLSSLFPIWLFSDVDQFHIWFTELFNNMAANFAGSGDIFPTFSAPNDILLLD